MRNNTFMEFGRLGRQGVLLAALAIAFLGVLVALIPQTAYAASEKEPNNSAQQATAMTLGNSYSGAISSSSDEDWFKVTLPSAGKFTLSLGHNYKKDYGRWDVELYAADKATELHSESWSNKSTGTDSFTMGLKAGTYYVRVDDYGWGSTVAGETYTLRSDFSASPYWEEEVNDDANAAKSMTLGASYSGIIDDSSDEDWFKVTLPSAGKFTLSLGHNYKKDYGRWDVELYAADKATELHSESWSNKSTGTDSFTMGLKAGTYYVRVDDYGWGSTVAGETYSLKVDRALNHASLSLKKSTVEYTGKSLKPTVTVKCAGAKLKKGRDYTVSYSSNKKIGTATITVKGKGQYAGASKSRTFKIVPKGTSIKKAKPAKKGFSVSVKKQTKQTTGYQLRYSTKKSMKGAKTAMFKNAKKTTLKVKKLKAKKTYYVQVRTYKKVGGKTYYYSSWSKAKAVKTKK